MKYIPRLLSVVLFIVSMNTVCCQQGMRTLVPAVLMMTMDSATSSHEHVAAAIDHLSGYRNLCFGFSGFFGCLEVKRFKSDREPIEASLLPECCCCLGCFMAIIVRYMRKYDREVNERYMIDSMRLLSKDAQNEVIKQMMKKRYEDVEQMVERHDVEEVDHWLRRCKRNSHEVPTPEK